MTHRNRPSNRTGACHKPARRLRRTVECLEHRFVMSISMTSLTDWRCSDEAGASMMLIADLNDGGSEMGQNHAGSNPFGTAEFEAAVPSASDEYRLTTPVTDGVAPWSDGARWTDVARFDTVSGTTGAADATTSTDRLPDLEDQSFVAKDAETNVTPSWPLRDMDARSVGEDRLIGGTASGPVLVAAAASAPSSDVKETAPPAPITSVDIGRIAPFVAPTHRASPRGVPLAALPEIAPEQNAWFASLPAPERIRAARIHADYFATTSSHAVPVKIEGEIVRDQVAVFLLGNQDVVSSNHAAHRTDDPRSTLSLPSVRRTPATISSPPSPVDGLGARGPVVGDLANQPLRIGFIHPLDAQVVDPPSHTSQEEVALLPPEVLPPQPVTPGHPESIGWVRGERVTIPAGWTSAWRPWWQRVVLLGTGS